jgi:hypothetical protein
MRNVEIAAQRFQPSFLQVTLSEAYKGFLSTLHLYNLHSEAYIDSLSTYYFLPPIMVSSTHADAGVARPSSSTGSITLNEADDKASTFVLVPSKDKSLIRRWFNGVRRVVFPTGAQKQPETSSSGKKSEESLVQASPSLLPSGAALAPRVASDEDVTNIKVEPASAFLSVSASAPAQVDLVAVPQEATVALTPLSDSTDLNDDKKMLTKPAKAKRSRKPHGPTMITPAVLDKIAKDNKRHQGVATAREAEVRRSSKGAGSSSSRVNGVQASPMRWSQD